MYNFRDIYDVSEASTPRPAEAVSIDGIYIEDAIDGYTTLYTLGRESLAMELNEQTVGTADGSRVLSTRYPARNITVGFQLIAQNSSDFRTKFNHLNNLLSAEQADFVFNDEVDKFFTGTPIADIEIEPGRNAITGEWHIYCADPFKYSIEPIIAEPQIINDTDAEFIIDYQGTYPAKPILQASFAGALDGGDSSQDGDCGFIAFMDADENIIQLGNPEAVDLDVYARAHTPINHKFTALDSSWAKTGGTRIENRALAGNITANNAITDSYWNSGKGQTLRYAKPTYGTGTGWHGPGLWKPMAGGANFEICAVHRMAISSVSQIGCFELAAYTLGTPNTVLAGILIDKPASGNNGTAKFYVDGKKVGSVSVDLTQYNTHFGYCKRTATTKTMYYNKKTKKWQTKKISGAKKKATKVYKYTQSNLNIKIVKNGNTVTFNVGNLKTQKYTVDGIENLVAGALNLYYGAYGTKPTFHTNATSSIKVVQQPSTEFANISNVFTAGDLVEADTGDASVTIRNENTEEGHSAPQYGALGNDWEEFILSRGTNQIKAIWSDWVNPAFKPEVRVVYNEVYI